jgi:hypothetical protein
MGVRHERLQFGIEGAQSAQGFGLAKWIAASGRTASGEPWSASPRRCVCASATSDARLEAQLQPAFMNLRLTGINAIKYQGELAVVIRLDAGEIKVSIHPKLRS